MTKDCNGIFRLENPNVTQKTGHEIVLILWEEDFVSICRGVRCVMAFSFT